MLNKKLFILVFFVIILSSLTISDSSTGVWVFDDQADWLSANIGATDHFYNIQKNQDHLELTDDVTLRNFIWIANSGESSISKVDTDSGKEVARYYTGPGTAYNLKPGSRHNPSRTAVDLDGNVWVGNRGTDKNVVKIAGDISRCIDRNGNGLIDTSCDVGRISGDCDGSGNGIIDPDTEMFLWDEDRNGVPDDECILLASEKLATGAAEGARAVAIDQEGYVWVGVWTDYKFVKIDPYTGEIIDLNLSTPEIDYVSTYPCQPYGAVIDQEGYLWASYLTSCLGTGRFDTKQDFPVVENFNTLGFTPYGLTVDQDNYIWIADHTTNTHLVRKINRDGTLNQSYPLHSYAVPAHPYFIGRGVTVDNQGYVWVADSYPDTGVLKIDPSVENPDDSVICYGSSEINPIGMILDSQGNVWVVDRDANAVKKLDPNDCTVQQTVPVGSLPYTYSDASGSALQNSIKHGDWWILLENTAGCDESSISNKISWTAENNIGDNIIIEAKTPQDPIFIRLFSGGRFTYEENAGKFLFTIKVTIKRNSDGSSPRLTSLTIDEPSCLVIGDFVVAKITTPEPDENLNTVEAYFNASGSYAYNIDDAGIQTCIAGPCPAEIPGGSSNIDDFSFSWKINNVADNSASGNAGAIFEKMLDVGNYLAEVNVSINEISDIAKVNFSVPFTAVDCVELDCQAGEDGQFCQYEGYDTNCVCMPTQTQKCQEVFVCGDYKTPTSCGIDIADVASGPSNCDNDCVWDETAEICSSVSVCKEFNCTKSFTRQDNVPSVGLITINWTAIPTWFGEIPENAEELLRDAGCVDGGEIRKINLFKLSFFTIKNLIIAVILIIIIYIILKNKKNKKTKKRKK